MAKKIAGPVMAKKPGGKQVGPVLPKSAGKQVSPALPKPAAPATSSRTSTGSPQGGFFGGSAPSGGAAPQSMFVDPGGASEEDYLAGDGTYQATISALKRQLEGFNADLDTQRGNRKLDYDRAVKDLGYQDGGAWNWDDILTASGRAYQNNSNDYAARGMLQSQGYADSINNLQRSLMDQYTGIDQSNTQFNTDLDRQGVKARDENTAASQAARAEAIMRRAAQQGFGV